MIQTEGRILENRKVADNTYVVRFRSPEISNSIEPGQFLNIKVHSGKDPLLRRPYSVYRTEGDDVEVIFNVVGRGSTALHAKREGDTLDVIGPLGVPFSLHRGDFDVAVLVGGGLGVAPLPISTVALSKAGIPVVTFIGARTASQLVESHLVNVRVATDDGSKGLHGTVVDLMKATPGTFEERRAKIFACGPTKMLESVAAFARERNIPCEVSLEGPMACGFGICQGCPVELADGEKKYALMCKEGPTFDIQAIKI